MLPLTTAHRHDRVNQLRDLLPDITYQGQEGHGPCWRCGGKDRFVVFASGRGWCRQCHWAGDDIQLLRDRDGLGFREACQVLGVEKSKTRPAPYIYDAEEVTFFRSVLRELWSSLEQRYEALRLEMTLCQWAALAIEKAPHEYTAAERREWARRSLAAADEYHTLGRLWTVAAEMDDEKTQRSVRRLSRYR